MLFEYDLCEVIKSYSYGNLHQAYIKFYGFQSTKFMRKRNYDFANEGLNKGSDAKFLLPVIEVSLLTYI